MDIKFLKKMIDTPSVSGNEYALQEKIIKEMKPQCDKIIQNLI